MMYLRKVLRKNWAQIECAIQIYNQTGWEKGVGNDPPAFIKGCKFFDWLCDS